MQINRLIPTERTRELIFIALGIFINTGVCACGPGDVKTIVAIIE